MNYCSNCGTKQPKQALFCSKCGEKIVIQKDAKSKKDTSKSIIKKINKKINIENNQSTLTRKLWYIAGFFLLIIIVALTEIIEIHPAIFFVSIFLFISAVIIGFMFRSREEKLQSLISGEKLLAAWTLNKAQKKAYANFLYQNEKNKNTIILFSISIIAVVVFGIFILVIDEGKLFMFLILIGLVLFLALFAFGAPIYYRFKNSRNDGEVLIGAKSIYINGFFHNWDFVLSGLSKVELIQEPFYGINLVYYYTDRTFTHSEELFIPANENEDLEQLIDILERENSKKKK